MRDDTAAAGADRHRERIIAAAARLLADGGPDAVSTRAVSATAGVQPPVIYRLFGDKQGLLDSVASDGFESYLASKSGLEPTDDPVEDLRAGWDLHVGLGLANPSLYTLMYGQPRPGMPWSPAALTAFEMLAKLIRRIAEAGQLRIPEDRAAALVHAAGCGTTLTLIATPAGQRDPELSHTAREAVVAAITAQPPAAPPDVTTAAVTLHAVLPQAQVLSAAERALLREWLDQIARQGPPPAPAGS